MRRAWRLKRVIVCGSRREQSPERRAYIAETLYRLLEVRSRNDLTVVHGAAKGVDMVVAECAEKWGLPVEPHVAQWGTYGLAAGPRRNAEMVALGADVLIAFEGGRGTANCIAQAERAGIEVVLA